MTKKTVERSRGLQKLHRRGDDYVRMGVGLLVITNKKANVGQTLKFKG